MTALILGTAQFGAGYGITNAAGRLSDEAVGEILGIARAAGIDIFDTAADYGDSQTRLGRLNALGSQPRYITKFSLPNDQNLSVTPDDIVGRSMRDLNVSSLHGVLFHRVSDLEDVRCAGVIGLLREARAAKVVSRIGVSIYDDADLNLALERFPDLDLLQIPGNLIDRRLLDHPVVTRLKRSGAEVHVRSAFLQGLVLARPDTLPQYFASLQAPLRELAELARRQKTTVLELALRFVKNHEVTDGLVVGATTSEEISGIVEAWGRISDRRIDISADVPAEILDPRGWPQQKVIS